ncbi:MAG: hypothetical protein WBF90_33575 [Rivularia sp. (in: cyanobacteria)]
MVAALQNQQESVPYPDSLDVRSVVPVPTIAEALEITEEIANDYIEKEQLPVTRVDGQWGLNVFTCDKLIGYHLKNKQKEIRFRLFPEIASKLPKVSEVIQKPNVLEMTLPKNFSVIRGRKKSLPINKALETALQTLPGGKIGGEHYIEYLEAIASKESIAENFIEAFANCYPNVSRAKQRVVQEAQSLLEQR